MKIKKLKYTLNFTLLWLLVSLFFPLPVIWACETEHSALQSCIRSLADCLYCEEHPWVMGCDGSECDGVTTVNWCWDEEFVYNSCLATQNSQGWNNEQWSSQGWNNGQWSSQGWSNGQWSSQGWNWWEEELLCDCNREILPNDTCYSQCNSQCEQPQECSTNDWEIWSTGQCKCICDSSVKCCWIQLNTVVPFIWDCIELDSDSSRSDTTSVNSVTAFPILMQWLMKIVMSVIMVFSFIMLIVAWLMMTAWSISNNSFTKWKTILKNVIISLILLWCSWLILSLINPSFFGG